MVDYNCLAQNWCNMDHGILLNIQIGAFALLNRRYNSSFYYCNRATKLVNIDIELPPL
jgi:hypothetical protein